MNMKDIQKEKDNRNLKISEVGITGLNTPLFFGPSAKKQLIIANVSMGVDLDATLKGTHMSRFSQIAYQIKDKELNEKLLMTTLKNIKNKLESTTSKINFDFTYFLNKKAPISGKPSSMSYQCKIEYELNNENQFIGYFQVKVPIATLCPCSKEISRYGAHNQRAEVSLRIKSHQYINLDDLIKVIEKSASCELFSLLKRVDEKYVTEKMYENPMFVEDIVREIGVWAKKDKRVEDYIIKCLSFESIHSHNAYAIIINEK